ncbi:hypothetical protein CCACVL1_05593 [Corchorus capsularis]|uniref:Uncharacterized protein n=1 Tax=Corchorus capsularis TaxID=210143 RepID=A0A1R3JJR8_COCAP|nr:hypothetical protein CCACVL1_05593 [Corchorus capsularis]
MALTHHSPTHHHHRPTLQNPLASLASES